ncbi:MAG: secretion system protein F [Alphaproteobacteria bacterium BRH_c36]|nr:MAG: secretion system protein F [Alphaproteobacteria bacterium BRH_c36]
MVNADLLFPVFGGIAVAALIFALIYPMFGADKSAEKRMASVTEARQVKVATRTAADAAANRRKQVSDKLKELEDRQKQKEKITLRLRLQRAGLQMTPQAFWISSAICGVICAVTVVMSFESSLLIQVAAMVAGFVGMFGLPRWILGKMTKWRQQKFLAEMANSLDVVVRGVKSGLPLNECLQIVARESPEPICSEFREVVDQQRIGIPLGEALERLAQRMPLPEVRFLTIVIGIQAQAGGNLSEALGNLSEVLRSRIRMAMKVKALSAEATASAAVLASLPPGVMGMVYLSSPDYIMPLLTTKMGHFMIAVGLFWMGCGVLVMQKMINFKY